MELTAKELDAKFKGKMVKMHGLNPGADSMPYNHAPSVFEGAHEKIRGFSAAGYSFFIDYWREGSRGELYGFYAAGAHPSNEPGFVCIELAEEPAPQDG